MGPFLHKQSQREQRIGRVAWIGLWINLVLAALKFLAGWVGHSHAVFSDGVHSLSDCSTDVALLIGNRFWGKPADDLHPYGHRRIETLVAIGIGVVLAIAGVAMGVHAIHLLRRATPVRPGGVAFCVAVVSIVVKELLYRWTQREGRATHSLALQANAWHHRSDALSSLPVAVAVAGAWLVPSWRFLDQVGSVLVSAFVLHAAHRVLWPALRELSESGAPEGVLSEIETLALAVPGVVEVHRLRTRYVGARLHADLHVLVDGALSVREGHEIATHVSSRIVREAADVIDVVVHLEPDSERLQREN